MINFEAFFNAVNVKRCFMKKYMALCALLFLSLFAGCSNKCPSWECLCPRCEECPAGVSGTTKAEGTDAEAQKPVEAEKKEDIPVTNDMNEVYAFIKAQKTYYIATVDGDQPRVRPFGTVHIFENRLYIQTGKKKNVAQQIAANPKVELVSYDGAGKWLRVAGKLVEDDRVEAQASMLEEYPELKSMYAPGDGNTVVYYLEGVEATFSSFGADPRVIKF